ncbi:PelD GGDEF domain-containing protein [Arsukibacterium sp.]|uniref:PelD GGDEF domain-containing protein n=1 Tax=Arsukibacterium sp. TaxID=1977258 RepID=UPI00299D5E20|nr:PelD GGDEF domain-containing protein [Arsukibacterium sp.]MDX1678969.1 PelD GGDEF domain-containing protein [Arsukibacterium sp.]
MDSYKRRGAGGVLYRMLFGSDHQLFAWFELLLITAAAMLIWVYQATLLYDRPQQYFFWPMLGPVVIALRYGFGRGMMSFVFLLIGFSVWQASHDQPFLLSMPVAVGTAVVTMLVGEFRDHWHDINERFELNHRFMEQKLKSFTQNYHLLKVSHDQLEQRVAGKQMSLRTGIQLLHTDALEQPDGRPVKLAERSLQVVSEIITLYQAGFYLVHDGKIDAQPLATIGNAHKLVADDAMLKDMLQSKALLSPADLIEHSDLYYQLTIPLSDINGKLQAVILAEKVRFVQLTDANVALVALLSGYIANFIANEVFVPVLKPEQRQLFRQYIRSQQHYYQRYAIDSSLVLFTDLTATQHLAFSQITDFRRGADIYWQCQTRDGQQALCVLLPMTTPSEAKQFIERVQSLLAGQQNAGSADLKLTGPLRVSAQQAEINLLLHELDAYNEDLADAANTDL